MVLPLGLSLQLKRLIFFFFPEKDRSKEDSGSKLGWKIRYKVAVGTARGLEYLHERCQRRIIHRDIKAANILLADDFEPQVNPL